MERAKWLDTLTYEKKKTAFSRHSVRDGAWSHLLLQNTHYPCMRAEKLVDKGIQVARVRVGGTKGVFH